MNILGISTPGPNASAALFDNRGIVAGIEEEKLTRLSDSQALPQFAIQEVLAAAGLRLADVGTIALAGRSSAKKRPRSKHANGEAALSHLRQLLAGRRFITFDHHLCHAASAFYTSDFSRSLVLTLDHGSAASSGLIALGEDDNLKSLHTLA